MAKVEGEGEVSEGLKWSRDRAAKVGTRTYCSTHQCTAEAYAIRPPLPQETEVSNRAKTSIRQNDRFEVLLTQAK